MSIFDSPTFLLIQHPTDRHIEMVAVDTPTQSVTPIVGMKYDYSGVCDNDHLAPNGTPEQVERAYGFPDIHDHVGFAKFWTVIHVFNDGANRKFAALDRIADGTLLDRYFQPLIDACLKQGKWEAYAFDPADEEDVYLRYGLIRTHEEGLPHRVQVMEINESDYDDKPKVGMHLDEQSTYLFPRADDAEFWSTTEYPEDIKVLPHYPKIVYVFNNELSNNFAALWLFLQGGYIVREFLGIIVNACLEQGGVDASIGRIFESY